MRAKNPTLDPQDRPYSHPPMAPEERTRFGQDWFTYVMHNGPPVPDSPFYYNGISNFVFGEMWSRPGLDVKTRRWITLACVGAADAVGPIRSHVYAALKSGDITLDEMREFILHFAVYLGWPKASMLQATTDEMWTRVQDEGGVEAYEPPDIADYRL